MERPGAPGDDGRKQANVVPYCDDVVGLFDGLSIGGDQAFGCLLAARPAPRSESSGAADAFLPLRPTEGLYAAA
jgi:hypothetical protein